jgi:hypothetical protein
MIKGRTEGRAERNTGIWKKIGIWINEKIENQKRYELNEILGTERKEKKCFGEEVMVMEEKGRFSRCEVVRGDGRGGEQTYERDGRWK